MTHHMSTPTAGLTTNCIHRTATRTACIQIVGRTACRRLRTSIGRQIKITNGILAKGLARLRSRKTFRLLVALTLWVQATKIATITSFFATTRICMERWTHQSLDRQTRFGTRRNPYHLVEPRLTQKRLRPMRCANPSNTLDRMHLLSMARTSKFRML
jgi:hypothetical protein